MNKRTLLWLPGWGFDETIWQPLLHSLQQFDHHFVHWSTIQSKDEITRRAENALLQASKQQGAPISLVGWSLGSLVALDLAARFPEIVDRLILFSATSCFTVQDNYKDGWDPRIIRRMQRRLQQDPQATLNDFYSRMFSSADQKMIAQEKVPFKGNEDSVDSLLFGLNFLKETDYRDRLMKINKPIHLIHGEEDVICPLGASQWIANHTEGSVSLKCLPKVGHLPFHIRTSQCSKLIQTFVTMNVRT